MIKVLFMVKFSQCIKYYLGFCLCFGVFAFGDRLIGNSAADENGNRMLIEAQAAQVNGEVERPFVEWSDVASVALSIVAFVG